MNILSFYPIRCFESKKNHCSDVIRRSRPGDRTYSGPPTVEFRVLSSLRETRIDIIVIKIYLGPARDHLVFDWEWQVANIR